MAEKPDPTERDEKRDDEDTKPEKPERRDAVQRAYDVVRKATAPHEPSDEDEAE